MSSRSRQSARTVRTQRSAKAFAFGARTGVRITLMPSARNTSSNARPNLLSRSWMRNPERLLTREPHGEVARLLSDSASVRVGTAGEVLDPSGRERDEEEDIDPLQEDGLAVRKLQANMLAACARKKVRHDEYVRCGAGGRPPRVARCGRTSPKPRCRGPFEFADDPLA